MDEFVLYEPTVRQTTRRETLAVRSASLAGSTIGLLWNGKPNGDLYLESMKASLASRYPRLEFVEISKPSSSRGMEPEQFEALRSCHAVVTALGD